MLSQQRAGIDRRPARHVVADSQSVGGGHVRRAVTFLFGINMRRRLRTGMHYCQLQKTYPLPTTNSSVFMPVERALGGAATERQCTPRSRQPVVHQHDQLEGQRDDGVDSW